MSNKELHIFKENTDAIATNRGFYYQHLITVKLWITNYICNNDMDIYCEWEDDITEQNQNTQKYKFHQVKSYSDKLGINDEHFISSILNFYNLNHEYNVDEFHFVTNSDFKPLAGKELKEWYENQQKGKFDIPDNIISIIKSNLVHYVTKRLEKGLDTTKDKKLKEQIKSKLSNFEDSLVNDDFIKFLKKIRFDITRVSDPKEDIENLEQEIVELLKSDKLIYDRTTHKEHLFRSIYYEVSKKSSNAGKTNRLLNRDTLERILNLVKIENVLDFYTDKELVVELNNIFELYPKYLEEITQAENNIKNKDLEKALEIYKKILEEADMLNQQGILEYKISKLYFQLENYDEAINICEKYNYSTKFLILKGICFGSLREYKIALQELLKISIEEQDFNVLYNIAVSYMFLSDLKNAIKYFTLSTKKNDKNKNSYLNLAICQYKLSPLDNDVLQNLDKALAIDKDMEEALSQKGEVLRFLGEYAKAKKLFKEALKVNSSNKIALYGLAMCLFENQEYRNGLIHFNTWFQSVYQKDINSEVIITDIGYEKIITLSVKTINNNLELHIDNHKFILQSNIGHDYMFIGSIEDDNVKYPIIGKKYLKFEDYLNTKTQIMDILNLKQDIIETDNKQMNHISTTMLEVIDSDKKLKTSINEDKNFIEIAIGAMTIEGSIEAVEGFYNFIDNYNKTRLCSIILENSENDQKFIIETYNRCEIIG